LFLEIDMFGSLAGLVGDVIKVAAAPVSIALDVTRSVTKPLADAATEVAKEVKEQLTDVNSK
jgi:preprotein translocase subunit YajC